MGPLFVHDSGAWPCAFQPAVHGQQAGCTQQGVHCIDALGRYSAHTLSRSQGELCGFPVDLLLLYSCRACRVPGGSAVLPPPLGCGSMALLSLGAQLAVPCECSRVRWSVSVLL